MNRISPAMERLVATAALVVAFLIMASVFAPDRSRGGETEPAPAGPEDRTASVTHEEYFPLGSLETGRYRVEIFGTSAGPCYSVYDAADGRELGRLMTAEEVAEWFHDLPLPEVDFSAPEGLLLSETEGEAWSD
ncbi:MAG: hypothetical protein JSV91_08255 [Phycisphaerales bacterium]|nr:MAG: hypothetical protein JSV91_08255 [Phycisphaerales bacterium]